MKNYDHLSRVRHAEFGTMLPSSVEAIGPFDPLAYCACPGRFRRLQRYARSRAGRALRKGGIGTRYGEAHATHSGRMTREQRETILDRAAEAYMDYFLHRDYAAAGIGADSPAIAVLSAAAWLDRARWRNPDEARPSDAELPYPYAGPKGDPTALRVLTAAESVAVDPADAFQALTGRGVQEGPGRRAVAVPGGPSGRGPTDGQMEWHAVAPCRGRWRMKRGRGRAHKYAPSLVIDSRE